MSGKLSYYYGTMGAAKSANLLMKKFQYERNGAICILAKPNIDHRNKGVIFSRIGVQEKCMLIDKNDNIIEKVMNATELKEYYEKSHNATNVVLLIDEVQFLTVEQITQLWTLANLYCVTVCCFGLKNTYNNKLFDASAELLAIVDPKNIHSIEAPCQRCNEDATTHLRLIDGVPIFDDNTEAVIGDIVGEEKFESVCQKCYSAAKIFNK